MAHRSISFSSAEETGAARYGLLLAATLGALLLWRIAALYASNTELFFDEAQYWAWSEELGFGYYSKPPFIAWLIRGVTEVCGDGEFCVRLASPLLYTATAAAVFFLAQRLYDARIGFWSAIVFATLPGVSLSAGIISTDVPLLFFWAAAMLAFVLVLETRSWAAAASLGLALGLGLLSKYAMIYFIICAALYAIWAGRAREILAEPRLYVALVTAALVLTPNLLWNLENRFATFSHTADNAKWSGSMFNISTALEFFGAQTGVFGLILFIALLVTTWRLLRNGAGDREKLLLSFCIPIIVIVTLQAFLSRAHANWAAPAYVAAAILVTAEMLRRDARGLFFGSLALHGAAILLLTLGNAFAGRFALPGGIDPYERVLGWRAVAQAAEKKALDNGLKAIATDRRPLTAEFIYYVKSGTPIVALAEGAPSDHFELTRPVTSATPEPMLFVAFKDRASRLTQFFAVVEPLGSERIPSSQGSSRKVFFYKLSGYKPRDKR